MISILCAMDRSEYYNIPKLDIWSQAQDAFLFTGTNPVIVHPPCQQWSRMRHWSRPDQDEKELAFHCLKFVIRNGGIFEHSAGSSFFKEVGLTSSAQIYSVDQSWWGFPARKRTYLFFNKCKPLSIPLNFEAYSHRVSGLKRNGSGWISKNPRLPSMKKQDHSRMTLSFCQWLVNCANQIN